jgi:hypothetical protein
MLERGVPFSDLWAGKRRPVLALTGFAEDDFHTP